MPQRTRKNHAMNVARMLQTSRPPEENTAARAQWCRDAAAVVGGLMRLPYRMRWDAMLEEAGLTKAEIARAKRPPPVAPGQPIAMQIRKSEKKPKAPSTGGLDGKPLLSQADLDAIDREHAKIFGPEPGEAQG